MPNPIDTLLDNYEQKKLSRRELVASLLAVAGTAALPQQLLAQGSPAPVATGISMNHVSLSVSEG